MKLDEALSYWRLNGMIRIDTILGQNETANNGMHYIMSASVRNEFQRAMLIYRVSNKRPAFVYADIFYSDNKIDINNATLKQLIDTFT